MGFPTDKLRPRPKIRFLEPAEFRRAVAAIRHDKVRNAVLVAALEGLRWSEQVALRIDDDVNWRRNRIVVSRSLYRRVPGTPKTAKSEGEVPICPTVQRILKAVPWHSGYIFSKDGTTPLGDGSWVKREWTRAQREAGIRNPISWHDLRHQFVCLPIAARASTRSTSHSRRGTTRPDSRSTVTVAYSRPFRQLRSSGSTTSFGPLPMATFWQQKGSHQGVREGSW